MEDRESDLLLQPNNTIITPSSDRPFNEKSDNPEQVSMQLCTSLIVDIFAFATTALLTILALAFCTIMLCLNENTLSFGLYFSPMISLAHLWVPVKGVKSQSTKSQTSINTRMNKSANADNSINSQQQFSQDTDDKWRRGNRIANFLLMITIDIITRSFSFLISLYTIGFCACMLITRRDEPTTFDLYFPPMISLVLLWIPIKSPKSQASKKLTQMTIDSR